jgi:ADP-ribosylglycohydrolase
VAPSTTARVLACLHGLSTGDAVGKQTENLSWEEVLRWYPDGVRGFEGQVGTVIPCYRGNRKREWLVGETTVDTERTLAVADAIIRDGTVTHGSLGRELLRCRKCVHPGIGDSDSVASIAGGIASARHPDSVDADWSAAVRTVNGHELLSVAEALARVRS